VSAFAEHLISAGLRLHFSTKEERRWRQHEEKEEEKEEQEVSLSRPS